MQEYEECERQARAARKIADAASNPGARRCWLEIAEEWASLAAQWRAMQNRLERKTGNARAAPQHPAP
jgi:hypothetical protein